MINYAISAPSNNATNASSGTMGLWSHLEELRVRLVRAALTIFILFVIALTLSKYVLNILKAPLEAALPANMTALHFTGPMDVFMVNIQIAVLASVILGAPAWLYHFWKFLEPALHEKERKYVLPFIGASVSCFLLGILFSYFFMLPMALKYLVGIGLEVAAPIITITDYVSLVTVILLGFGVVFETPVLLVLLALLDLVSAETLAAQRRVTCVIILIIAAIITPPDPVSMLGMAIPCYLMYELSIFIIRFIKPNGEKNRVLKTESTSRKENGDRPTTSNQYPDPKIGL